MSSPRQIATKSTAAQIVYTVPTGRKFVGYIHGTGAQGAYTMTPSNGYAAAMEFPVILMTSLSTTPMLLTLIAGTIITNSSANALHIIGVESDL